MALLCLVCTTHTDSIVRSLIHQNFGLQECCAFFVSVARESLLFLVRVLVHTSQRKIPCLC